MGGFGSGRWGWHTPAALVEHCRVLDLTELAADGALRPGAAGVLQWHRPGGTEAAAVRYAVAGPAEPVLRITYRFTRAGQDSRDVDLPVRLVRLPAPRGGGQWVGVCPLAVNGAVCGRRAAKLYLPPGQMYFGCRTCHRLAYASSRDHDPKADALRRDPGALAKLLEDPGRAPIAMLGTALAALRRERAADDRAMRALERKGRRRGRRRARRAAGRPTTGGQTDGGGNPT